MTAAEFQRRLSRTARGAAAQVSAAFARVDPDRLVESWRDALPAAARVWVAAQLAAAAAAQEYVSASVAEQGGSPQESFRVDPRALVVADASMLGVPAFAALRAISAGRSPGAAVAAARSTAATMTQTRVSFAGTGATHVATLLEPDVVGYVRVLTLPSCGRCAVLAGRIYRTSEAFARHPGCDCTMEPMVVGGGMGQTGASSEQLDVRTYFDSLSEREQNRLFGKQESDAIRGGGDPVKAVNVKRDVWRQDRAAAYKDFKDEAYFGPWNGGNAPKVFLDRARAERTGRGFAEAQAAVEEWLEANGLAVRV